MTTDTQHAKQVLNALNNFVARIDEIVGRLEVEQRPSQSEREAIQSLIKSLHADIANGARFGTVSGTRSERNEFEETYYYPALRDARDHFNTPPSTPVLEFEWPKQLDCLRRDFKRDLIKLELEIPTE